MSRIAIDAIYTTIAAVGIGAALMNPAVANPMGNPTNGDPFPNGSSVYLSGGPFATPFGTFSSVVISNFGTPAMSGSGGNQYFDYTPTLTITYAPPTSPAGGTVAPTQSFPGIFDVEVVGRTSLTQTGTFVLDLTTATFSGTTLGVPTTATLDPNNPSIGTATFTSCGMSCLLVSTLFDRGKYTATGGGLNSMMGVNNGPLMQVPLQASSSPVPEIDAASGTGAIGLLLGALALAGERRRRKASGKLEAA